MPLIAGAALIALLAAAGFFYYRYRHSSKLTEQDTIILADFTNTTGDAVFDDTLKQALAIQLEQSPFLRIVSEERVQQTLRLMSQPVDTHLNPKIAREICQRTQSAAVLEGSIASLDNEYIVGIKAVNCATGDVLAQQQARVEGKTKVLQALDGAAIDLRQKLGESLSTVQKFDTPIERATTSSIEALKAFSTARKIMLGTANYAAAIAPLKKAIDLDPNFAMAHAALATCYNDLAEIMAQPKNLAKPSTSGIASAKSNGSTSSRTTTNTQSGTSKKPPRPTTPGLRPIPATSSHSTTFPSPINF